MWVDRFFISSIFFIFMNHTVVKKTVLLGLSIQISKFVVNLVIIIVFNGFFMWMGTTGRVGTALPT